MKKVITFGTFDLFHNGHLNILERAKLLGDYLIVGVSSDTLNAKKHKVSVMPVEQRARFIEKLHCVDEVFIEESLELKQEYIDKYDADLLVMGDDWQGKFDWVNCAVTYLPRTESISTTLMKLALLEGFRRLKIFVVTSGSDKHRGCARPIVDYMKKIGFMVVEQKRYDDFPDDEFDAVIDFNKPVRNLRDLYPNTPIFIIDHGASNLKWFLKNQDRYDSVDFFLTAGLDHVKSMQAFFGEDDAIMPTAFVKSDLLLSEPENSRATFCQENNLASDQPIILYAPTWLKDITDDHKEILNQLTRIPNHIICQHIDHTQFPTNSSLNVVKNNNYNIIEFMKQADVIISDTSSILQESAALRKPTIQVLMKEYINNPSRDYQLPLTAGTNKYFLAGLPARPEILASAVTSLEKFKNPILFLQEKVLEGTTIKSNPCRDIVEGLINGVNSYSQATKKGISEDTRVRLHQHLKLVKTNKIAHAGGEIDGVKYSNSLEAIKQSANKFKLIEVDICRAKDGLIVAHNGLESKYGFNSRFDEITIKSFSQSRFNGKYKPLLFSDLAKYAVDKYVCFVLDTKEEGKGFSQCLKEISSLCMKYNVLNKFIPQVYCQNDFKTAITCGFDKCLIALWKNFDTRIFSDETFEFLDSCFSNHDIKPMGISLRYEKKGIVNIDRPEVLKLHAYGVRIYIHGQSPEKNNEILSKNFGIFSS